MYDNNAVNGWIHIFNAFQVENAGNIQTKLDLKHQQLGGKEFVLMVPICGQRQMTVPVYFKRFLKIDFFWEQKNRVQINEQHRRLRKFSYDTLYQGEIQNHHDPLIYMPTLVQARYLSLYCASLYGQQPTYVSKISVKYKFMFFRLSEQQDTS